MSEVKNIKGIDDETWADFKGLAAHNRLKAAAMFRVLVDEYKKKSASAWEKILSHKPIFPASAYDEIERRVKSVRKEKGWRI
jgi:hypothetical protein